MSVTAGGIRRSSRVAACGAVVLVAAVTWAVARAQSAPADDAEAKPAAAPTGSAAPATTVRIVFKVVPPNIATITWGNKRLGIIKPHAPLIIERPRDSGPLDVVVKSQGYVTVHTRAYTFTDSTVAVHLTTVDKKNTIYGYREAPPPDADGGVSGPDGGAPPPSAAPGPSPVPAP